MSKLKILEMIDQTFLGGGQVNLLSLAESLDPSRFEVAVCSRGQGPLVEEVKARGHHFYPVAFRKRIDRCVLHSVRAVLSDFRPDILHTHGGVAGLFGRWAARRNPDIALVHTLHGIHYLHFRNIWKKYFYIRLERFYSRFSDAVIFVSDEDKKLGREYRLAPSAKMRVIKNGIDFSACSPSAEREKLLMRFQEEIGADLSGPLVGTIARLHFQKGIPYLLHAAGSLCRMVSGLKIIIIGGGPEEEKLRQMNLRLNNEGKVFLLGERKDALDWLSLFNIVILPSLWEGLPYVLLEAAAFGKTVVATNVPGNRELIQNDRTGVLVPPRDPEKMAEAVADLLGDPQKARRLGGLFRQEVSEKYTLSAMAAKTIALYNEVGRENS